jgi:flavin-dependent dehydrogenase
MQQQVHLYDAAIIGGGLAGLALSIQLVRKGYAVVLFEKEEYPFHKVCGEYISREAWPFLESLGVPLSKLQLPQIDMLQLTAPNGNVFETKLPLGGFGISRFTLDQQLYNIAKNEGVIIQEASKVEDVEHGTGGYTVHYTRRDSGRMAVTARICIGAYGKRSNLDVKWKRGFVGSKDKKLNNYIAVKYHISGYTQPNTISLHNFQDGYCGISEVEKGTYCLCYLTTAANLQRVGGQISQLESQVLSRNPFLATILKQCIRKESFPVTIAQISFSSKTWVEKGVLMLGDAAGMITPLCGNGMSMALHSSKIVATLVDQYLTQAISFEQLVQLYQQQWRAAFENRMRTGRLLQRFFGRVVWSNLFVELFRRMPFMARPLIKKTHGQPF